MNAEKIVIITGAGRGIGAATAKLFADKGYKVCINYRQDKSSADSVAKQIRAMGASCITVPADISIESDVIKLFEAVDTELGKVSVLVNNAGILLPQMRLETMNAERINKLFAINVTGSFLCCREAVKRMSTKHGGSGGSIINVSSGAAKTGSPNEYIDYAASKGAVDTLTVGLAREVATEGIRVNGVRPGPIYTTMHADGGEPDRIERIKKFIPMQRGGTPEEIANAIYWLSSSAASYATGSFIDVTGGV